ncbi:MAG: dephospho-CoA kinase [Ruminococcus sp.]|nr:dephospho-CoA kinase [Ruminococcus sp.]
MRNYKLIGLTGTTGAGKGEVVKILSAHGYGVIVADELAREIMKNEVVLESIKSFFGEDVVRDNVLDRGLLAERAFCDKEQTALLNCITHPHITALFFKKLSELANSGYDKIVLDAPQLFESKINIVCDKTIAVLADEGLRLNRITLRDNLSEKQAKQRINVQLSDEFFAENCDYIIYNNSTVTALTAEVERIIREL